jgi:hypothetical protein
MKSIKRLILLLSCLIFTEIQTLSLTASAQLPNVQSFNNNRAAITAATSLTIPTGDSPPSANKPLSTARTSNYFSLEKGNLLLSPETNICVGVHEATICIAAGAALFVMESGQDIVVYDLYQKKQKQVSIVIGSNKIFMEPGRMVVLTKQNTDSFENLEANCHSISYRRPQQVNLHNSDMTAFVADFSILSALANVKPLKRLAISEDRRDKLVLERILRGALILANFGKSS